MSERGKTWTWVLRLVVAAIWIAAALFFALGKPQESAEPQAVEEKPGLPRFLDLGSTTCHACKQMEGVIEALREEFGDRMQVDFIDVALDHDAGTEHGIKLIPTQILFAPDGTELFRHEGFFSREAILAKWDELGYPMAAPEVPESPVEEAEPSPSLFARLTAAVEQGTLVALVAAGIWGVLSIVLSPCHLASIPLIVGFIQGQGKITTRRACGTATLFSLGILLTIAALGAVTAAMGRVMGDVGPAMNYVVAAVFLVVGMHLLDLLPSPWGGPGNVNMKKRGLCAAFVLGLVFGIALGPCTFAYMAPVLATTLKVGASRPLFAAALLLAYGVGHCSVIILAGTSSEWVQRYLSWNQESSGAIWLRRICGLLVLIGGLYLVHVA